MGHVTRFSGMFAQMAVEYERTRRRGRQAPPPREITREPAPSDEASIRAAMERAIARRMGERKA